MDSEVEALAAALYMVNAKFERQRLGQTYEIVSWEEMEERWTIKPRFRALAQEALDFCERRV